MLKAGLSGAVSPVGFLWRQFSDVCIGRRCFEADVDKYVYEICPHGSAVQKDGAARVSLGNWEGFREGHTVMAFTGGQHCWNGPQRSMVVRA